MTSFVGNHGLVAVFVLMFVSAVLPAASELTMIYGGALASGALAGHIAHFHHGINAYLAVVVTGIVANTLGALGGWAIGYFGGHPLLERHGRWIHATPARIERAERWFDRFGTIAVPLGFACPLIRSFVALPAGILEWQLRRLVPLAAIGSAVFCFALAALGWALGESWHSASNSFHYVDYVIAAAIVAMAAYWLLRLRRTATLRAGHGDTPR